MAVAALMLAIALGSLGNRPLLAASPANDELTGAVEIGSIPFEDVRQTSSATAGPKDGSCFDPGPSVWYAFTPVEAGGYRISTIGSSYDTAVAVGTFVDGEFVILECNDDGATGSEITGLEAVLDWQAAAGQRYLIMVSPCCSLSLGNDPDLELVLSVDHVPGTTEEVPAETSADQALEGAFADLFGGSTEDYDPIDVPPLETLPRYGDFQGVRISVDTARVTNTHPYPIVGEPTPGPSLFAILDVTATNVRDAATDYDFGEGAFSLRAAGGQRMPLAQAPGIAGFRRLEAGETAAQTMIFGVLDEDALEGAALLVGRSPDMPSIILLTDDPPPQPYLPANVTSTESGPFHVGVIEWSIVDGVASLDRPDGLCCPETGLRADDGELFVRLRLDGQVKGSEYGHATVTNELVRLVVDGTAMEPIMFDAMAAVEEGSSYVVTVDWVVPEFASILELELLGPDGESMRAPLLIGP